MQLGWNGVMKVTVMQPWNGKTKNGNKMDLYTAYHPHKVEDQSTLQQC